MSQIATFFNPVPLPVAAGATAIEQNAATPDDRFAATLLSINTALGITDPNTPAALEATPNASLLGILVAPTPAAPTIADTLASIDAQATLAAQFSLLQGISIDATPQAAAATSQANAAAASIGIASSTGSVAAPGDAPGQSLEAASAASLLRGSIAPDAQTAAAPQQAEGGQAKSAAATAIVEAVKNIAAPAKPANSESDAARAASAEAATAATPAVPATANAPAKRATPATPAIPASPSAAADQSQANPNSPKSGDVSPTSAVPPLTGERLTSVSEQSQGPASSTTQSTPPSFIGAATTTLPPTIAAQQLNTVLIATTPTTVPLEALAVNIARKFEQGSSEFEIRLHPADLGKLDITLTVTEDGRVQATLRAERPETLELLQRDARSLEQQLRNAGLDVGSNALSFSLSNGQNQRQTHNPAWPAFADANDAATAAQDLAISNYVAVRVRDGIDIRV